MINNLTIEIIRRILANVGAVITTNFGNAGITESNLKMDKLINVSYEGVNIGHSVYSGQLKINNSSIKGCLVDLTNEGVSEFLFLFRMDDLPVYAIHMVYDEEFYEECYFRKYDYQNDLWQNLNIYSQAKILSDFERFVSFGFLWEEYHTNDLYEILSKLI